MGLQKYQKDFIDFLVRAEVLCFGDFVTKSGRKTPYFVNAGNFNSGERIAEAGSWYAKHLLEHKLTNDLGSVFGPAYKGIPLCVATAMQLFKQHGISTGFTFDRKEEKLHGDKGSFVGTQLKQRDSVVLVEDVVTAGTTLKKMLPLLKDTLNLDVRAVVVAVDRKEKGDGEESALTQITKDYGVPILPIVCIYDIIDYLSQDNSSGKVLQEHEQNALYAYLQQYGAADPRAVSR